jgi:hypothetical protein
MFTAADKVLDCVGPLITVVIYQRPHLRERAETAGSRGIKEHRHRRFVFTEREKRLRENSKFRGTLKCPPSPQGVKARNIPIGTVKHYVYRLYLIYNRG